MSDEPSNLRLPALRPVETRGWRWTCVVLALIVCAAFYLVVSATNVAAFPGVDQNGYLVGGRTLLEHGIHGYQPRTPDASQPDPFGFVGRMWIGVDLGTEHERYYPKYPVGLPALVAMCLAVGGQTLGPALAYGINPLAMTLGMLFTFLLIREIAGSTLGLLGMIVMATLPATMQLANNPNSHATALLCVAASMFFLLSWMRHGGAWRIALAGFLAGYAVTIRYTEGLLILPLLIAWLTARKTDEESRSGWPWKDGVVLLVAWLIPVGALIGYNLAAFGTLTGYDPCNESTGFSLQYAADNWLTMLELFATRGAALFFPFAIAGLIALCRWRPRLAAVLIAWIVPAVVTYTFYYWAPDNVNTTGYMRFFLTVMPGLFAAAMAMFAGMMEYGHDESLHIGFRRFWITIAGALVAVAALLNVGDAVPGLLVDQVRRLGLANQTQCIEVAAPPGSVIFSTDTGVLHHLQFVDDYMLYSTDIFNARRVETMGDVDPDEPTGFQPQRQLAIYERLKDKNPHELWDVARQLIVEAQRSGRRVFVVEPLKMWRGRQAPFSMQALVNTPGWSSRQVASWMNTTVGDHTPQPGDRRIVRRKDPFASYRAMRDAGKLIEILPPPLKAKPAAEKNAP